MKVFGTRLKLLREKHNLTQLALSTRLGMAQESISAYERDNNTPSIEVLKEIADYFNVSADYLLGIDDLEVRINEHTLDAFEVTLLRNFRILPQMQKELLVKISANMVELYHQQR